MSNCVGRKSSGIRPKLGFSPTTPDHDAGIRTDPPMSDPSASGTQPEATAAPDPPEEPPGVRSAFQGFRVIPHRGLSVKLEYANSGVVVLPTMIAPAPSSFSTRSGALLGDVVLERVRAHRCPLPLRRGEVLDRDRDAVQRPERPAASCLGLGLSRQLQSLFGIDEAKTVQ